MTSIILFIALCLDTLLGEPRKFHPLVGFGNLASLFEKKVNRAPSSRKSLFLGTVGFIVLIFPFVLISAIITHYFSLYGIIEIIILYWAIGHQSLRQHINAVKSYLLNNETSKAQKSLAMIVSRQTSDLDQTQITKATIETGLDSTILVDVRLYAMMY